MSPEQIAKEFAATLESDPAAKISFLTANCQNFIWLQCPPCGGKSVDFWQYGPPIPEAEVFLFLLAETWYHGGWGGWVVSFSPEPIKYGTYEFVDQAKKIVEMRMAEKWGPANPLSVSDLGKTILFDPEANKGSVTK